MEEKIIKTCWMISIRRGTERKDIDIVSRPDELPIDAYKRVKANVARFREKLGPEATIDIVSYTLTSEPRGNKQFRGQYWCPYCAKWRIFKYDEYLGVNKCSICHMTDRDFYVRKYNDLWKKERRERK